MTKRDIELRKHVRWLCRADMTSAWVKLDNYRMDGASERSIAALAHLIFAAAARRDDLICLAEIRKAAGFEKRKWGRVVSELEDVGAIIRLDDDCWSVEMVATWIAGRPRPKLSEDVRTAVLAKTNGLCAYCDVELSFDNRYDATFFNVDHIVAITHGGTDDLDNLNPSCRRCNVSKNCSTLDQWTPPNRRADDGEGLQ